MLDLLGGPSVITGVIIGRRQGNQNEEKGGVKTEPDVGSVL